MIGRDDIHPAMRVFIGAHSALRNLGFSTDRIFALVATSGVSGELTAFCVLKLSSDAPEFVVDCGPVDSSEAFEIEYRRVCAALESGEISREVGNQIWQESEAYQHPESFLIALISKGILPPARLPGESN